MKTNIERIYKESLKTTENSFKENTDNIVKVIEEIISAGFVQVDDKPFLRANYFLEFRKAE